MDALIHSQPYLLFCNFSLDFDRKVAFLPPSFSTTSLTPESLDFFSNRGCLVGRKGCEAAADSQEIKVQFFNRKIKDLGVFDLINWSYSSYLVTKTRCVTVLISLLGDFLFFLLLSSSSVLLINFALGSAFDFSVRHSSGNLCSSVWLPRKYLQEKISCCCM